jgi:hypothetical protein
MLTPVKYSQQVLKPIYEERREQTKNVPGFVKELEVVKDTPKSILGTTCKWSRWSNLGNLLSRSECSFIVPGSLFLKCYDGILQGKGISVSHCDIINVCGVCQKKFILVRSEVLAPWMCC